QNTSKSVTVSTKDKKIWGPTHTEIISESGRTVIEIKEDHYRWVAPLRNLVETSISGTWIEKLVKPFYDLPLSPGLNSGTRVTVPDVDGKDIVIYEQRKKYNPRTLIGRHESEVTFYKDTESEAKATIKAECGFWRTYRLLNPYFYAEYLKMKVLGTPTEFPGGRHRMGGYDLGFFSPLESITISRTDKNGQKRKGMITVTDTLPHADPVYTLWKGTPEGSLLFNYDTLDKDEIYQDIITSRIWHVDPIVSHNMGKGSFSRDESGNIQVKYPNPKNHSEMKDLGRFEIDDDKCYFRLSKSRGIREFFSDRSDILIGDVRNEDGNINVYTDKKEIGHIVSQLKIKNIENAVYYKKKQVDVSESTGNIFGDLPTSDDFFTLDKSDAKKEKETREVLVPYINLDKLLREHKANIFTTPGEENAIEYMGMLIALLGVGAEDIGLANRDWELKKLNIYTVPKRIDRVLDLITATGKTHDLNQNIENVISVFIGPNLLPKKMGYALDDMLDVEPPEELSHHLSNIWEKN
ncbi:MAG: hypothetical protein KAH93_06170, partial [Candidatus Aenigmarchaeota archaeon]|nr:hypothetical protein [Candidatus Aenigmarchaeota archaeon]